MNYFELYSLMLNLPKYESDIQQQTTTTFMLQTSESVDLNIFAATKPSPTLAARNNAVPAQHENKV